MADHQIDAPALAARAHSALSDAADALLRANALLFVIKKAVNTGQVDDLCAYSLIDTALEVTGWYAERADSEADFFAEARHA